MATLALFGRPYHQSHMQHTESKQNICNNHLTPFCTYFLHRFPFQNCVLFPMANRGHKKHTCSDLSLMFYYYLLAWSDLPSHIFHHLLLSYIHHHHHCHFHTTNVGHRKQAWSDLTSHIFHQDGSKESTEFHFPYGLLMSSTPRQWPVVLNRKSNSRHPCLTPVFTWKASVSWRPQTTLHVIQQ